MAPIRSRRQSITTKNYAENDDGDDHDHEQYVDSGDEYVPPAKKNCRTKQKTRSGLTRKERLERLKKISAKYAASSSESVPSQQTNQVDISQENKVEINNFDHLFTDNERETNERETNNRSIIVNNKTVQETTAHVLNSNYQIIQKQNENLSMDPVMQMMLKFQGQIELMIDEFTLLRRQVCRLELKAAGLSNKSDDKVQNEVTPEDLLDFNQTLHREGLPLKTCVETNDFELKLKANPDFRNRIVRISNIRMTSLII